MACALFPTCNNFQQTHLCYAKWQKYKASISHIKEHQRKASLRMAINVKRKFMAQDEKLKTALLRFRVWLFPTPVHLIKIYVEYNQN